MRGSDEYDRSNCLEDLIFDVVVSRILQGSDEERTLSLKAADDLEIAIDKFTAAAQKLRTSSTCIDMREAESTLTDAEYASAVTAYRLSQHLHPIRANRDTYTDFSARALSGLPLSVRSLALF